MPGTTDRPFGLGALTTIPLRDAPLLRVLVQVRFAQVLAVADEAFVGKFQQAIIERFPRAHHEIEFAFALPVNQPGKEQQVPPAPTPVRIWRFRSLDDEWVVSLGSNFVALESANYPGNDLFFRELTNVLAATVEHINPRVVERLGVRYTQRLDHAEDLVNIETYMRPEILGIVPIADEAAQLRLALTQSEFVLAGETLSARWGVLPAGVSFDPTLTAIDRPSWIFDIDTYEESPRAFDAAALTARAFELSRTQYRFFRWAVTREFLLRFGADAATIDEAITHDDA